MRHSATPCLWVARDQAFRGNLSVQDELLVALGGCSISVMTAICLRWAITLFYLHDDGVERFSIFFMMGSNAFLSSSWWLRTLSDADSVGYRGLQSWFYSKSLCVRLSEVNDWNGSRVSLEASRASAEAKFQEAEDFLEKAKNVRCACVSHDSSCSSVSADMLRRCFPWCCRMGAKYFHYDCPRLIQETVFH